MTRQILPIVVVCICFHDNILLLRRYKEPFKDQWSLPGGKIDYGEFIDRAAIREIKEETGLIINPLTYLGMVCELVLPTLDSQPLYQHLVYVFGARISEMANQESSEGDLCWFKFDELQTLGSSLVATDREIIDKMLLDRQKGPFNSTVLYTQNTYQCLSFVPINNE